LNRSHCDSNSRGQQRKYSDIFGFHFGDLWYSDRK
jgi:hypothetical protein